MTSYLLAFVLVYCPATIVINESGEKWNKMDKLSLKRAKIGCVEHFPKDPCLKKFIKRGYHNYYAICGKSE